ncbi:MAG: type 4b pilus protein PilO2 [Alphaproteobacteria bacterium]|nr:type 4b pilus protein PilO2 [Alphaproteobacteria bacterium]
MAADDEDELTVDDLEDDADGLLDDTEEESEGSSDPSWGPTMVVNNTTYAVSLFWQPLQDTNDPYPEVKETVENVMEGADLFCLRSGTSPQYGIGNSTEGHKAGMPSAAAAVAEIFQDKPSSVAVFEVDEGWWFIAVRNDLILSEEDILYLKEEDAKRAFYAMMAVPDWGRKIAPASWEIEGTEEVDLWDILKNPGGSKLMHINKGNPKTKLITIGAGLLVLFIGWKLISGLFVTQKKPVVRPLAPLQPLFEEEEAPPPKEVIVRPWEKLVVTEDLLNRCQAAVQQIKMIVVPGWKSGMVSCSSSGASTTWTMEWGDLSWLKRAFAEYNTRGMDFIIDDAGKTAVISLSIGDIAIHSQAPKLRMYESREELNNIFQAIKMNISLQEERPVTSTSVNQYGLSNETKTIQKISYPKLHFSFSSDLPMENWLGLFNKFPALEITRLQYDPNSNTWTYEGQIYEPIL